MNRQRKIKVWNKTVIISGVPDCYTDEELIAWTKKRLIIDGMHKNKLIAS